MSDEQQVYLQENHLYVTKGGAVEGPMRIDPWEHEYMFYSSGSWLRRWNTDGACITGGYYDDIVSELE